MDSRRYRLSFLVAMFLGAVAFAPSAALAHAGHSHAPSPEIQWGVHTDHGGAAERAVVFAGTYEPAPVHHDHGPNTQCDGDCCPGYVCVTCGTAALAPDPGDAFASAGRLRFSNAEVRTLTGLVPGGPPRPPKSLA